MPDDSAGNYSPPPGYLAVTGQTVLASQHNPPIEDSAAAMSRRYMRDGRAPMLGNIPMNGYRATGAGDAQGDQDYVTLAQMLAAVAAVQGVPTGRIVVASGTQIEPGYVAANGQSLLRATYPALWAYAQASGNLAATQGAKTVGQYGPGNGSTTFTLPNLNADNGYFIRPISSGRAIGTVQADDFKAHDHPSSVNDPGHDHTYNFRGTLGGFSTGGSYWTGNQVISSGSSTTGISVSVGSRGGTETRPKNIAYPFLIKT